METQITSSKEGDFFRWHSDNGQDELPPGKSRLFISSIVNPKMFEGGELRISKLFQQQQRGGHYTIVPRRIRLSCSTAR